MKVTTSRRKRMVEVETANTGLATTVSTVTTYSLLKGLEKKGGRSGGGGLDKYTVYGSDGNNKEKGGRGENGGNSGNGKKLQIAKNSALTRLVAVNAQGRPVGQDHPRAVLADAEIDLVFALREEGFSMGWLADKFEVSKSCIQGILSGRRRAVIPAGYRRVRVKG